MFWPVVSSTATTLAAFAPMLFWPDVTGKFMSYLPLTMIFIMTASMFVSLLFLPTIGALLGKPEKAHAATERAIHLSEKGDLYAIGGWVGGYARLVTVAVRHPFIVLALVGAVLAAITVGLFTFGKGVELFVEQDTNEASFFIARAQLVGGREARSSLSREARARCADCTRYIRCRASRRAAAAAPVDTIGRVFMN
jgi:multidrug efflux pump